MVEVPDFVVARDHVRNELIRFVRALRRTRVNVPANAGTTAARALVEVGFEDRERAQIALRACLITDQTHKSTFDDLFAEFWRRLTVGLDADGPAQRPEDGPDGGFAPLGAEPTDGEQAESSGAGKDDERDRNDERTGLGAVVSHETAITEEEGEVTTARYSPTGRRTAISVPEIAGKGFDGAFRSLTRVLSGLASRRWGTGDDVPHVRRALRASIETGGTVVDVPRRERKRTAVRARLLVDVSQSVLDVLDRSFLLRFLRRARAEWRDVRLFFFDESLREVTESFDAETQKAAFDALERAETEWGGGTRIGGSLECLRGEFPHSVDRQSVVFVVSDGLEMGEVSTLETELSVLSQKAGAVFWLNPLAASSAYEPTARGMAAALPYLDGLFAFTGPTDIEEIARQLQRQGIHGRVGYEYDTRRTA
ncbi:VWA domain-containing protein (plasmid) [Halococcus dombrowskii]|uniref:VWA domain-containing protein n=1 Tax=Halococcus dombrowskii TaxID=179637 RepID=A0AAV3SKW5_HALDO|nr:VWA domain-containing protein [Halococcus dombrowskii]UOO97003.1 VWA domain-containing protein [Halococcus dombrowskii]